MPKIRMTKGWHHQLDDRRRQQYRKGREYNVKDDVAEAAIKAGAAEEVKAEKAKG